MLESRGIVYTTPFVLTNMYRARWGEELGYGITTAGSGLLESRIRLTREPDPIY